MTADDTPAEDASPAEAAGADETAPIAAAPVADTVVDDVAEESVAAIPADSTGRVLVTGTTGGIGRAIAVQLAKKGVKLVLHCRDEKAGESMVAELRQTFDGADIELVTADLSSQAETTALAQGILDKHPSLAAVINNAGVYPGARALTDDGIELAMAVNHVAPFMLTQLLLPVLEADHGGRVVNVNSFMHKRASINFEDLQSEKDYSPTRAYARSKLADLMTTYMWSRKLSDTKVTINAYNPGIVRTKMLGGAAGPLAGLIAKSPKSAATTAVFLATSPRIRGVTGCYYAATGSTKASSKDSLNKDLQGEMWTATEALIKN